MTNAVQEIVYAVVCELARKLVQLRYTVTTGTTCVVVHLIGFDYIIACIYDDRIEISTPHRCFLAKDVYKSHVKPIAIDMADPDCLSKTLKYIVFFTNNALDATPCTEL